MRDFAKNNKNSVANRTTKNGQKKAQSSLALRKLILALLLLTLIAAFVISFYNTNKSRGTIKETPQSEVVSITPKIEVQSNNKQIQNSDKNIISKPATHEIESIEQDAQASTAAALPSDSKASTETKITKKMAKKESKDAPLIFTFYNTLTNKTVQVDANPEKLKQYRYTYMLQIGSYRNQSDANATRAKLILAGLSPIITKVGDWYRLDVGPVYNQRDGDVLKHKVEAAGISGSILRQVDKQEITEQTGSENP